MTSWNQFSYEGFREIQAEAAVEGDTIAEITMQLVQADPDQISGMNEVKSSNDKGVLPMSNSTARPVALGNRRQQGNRPGNLC